MNYPERDNSTGKPVRWSALLGRWWSAKPRADDANLVKVDERLRSGDELRSKFVQIKVKMEKTITAFLSFFCPNQRKPVAAVSVPGNPAMQEHFIKDGKRFDLIPVTALVEFHNWIHAVNRPNDKSSPATPEARGEAQKEQSK